MGFRENCSLIVVIDCLIVAVALNVWVLYSCEFLAAREDLYDLRVGVFRYSLNLPTNAADTGGNCERRDFDTANGYVQAAQVCGVLAPIFGIALVLLTAINRLWRPVPCGGILGSLADMGATVGTSLVWLVFRTDLCTTIPGVRCQWGTAAIGNLLALALYVIAGFVENCMPSTTLAAAESRAEEAETRAEQAEGDKIQAEERAKLAEQRAAEAEVELRAVSHANHKIEF